MRRKNGWSEIVPSDWNEDRGFHGFGRSNAQHCYSVRLCVEGKQHEIAQCKSQLEAARAYDAALSLLLVFAPLCAVPNFPDDFPTLTRADAETLCPKAVQIGNAEWERLSEAGVDIVNFEKQRRALRELHRARNAGPKVINELARSADLLGDVSRQITDVHYRISRLFSSPGKLAKLPQVAGELEKLKTKMISDCLEYERVKALLINNQTVYAKFKAFDAGETFNESTNL